MSLLKSLASAFKGGAGRVPLARGYTSPWSFASAWPARPPYEYQGSVRRAYLDNPVAQRAVRLVAEGIGQAPLAAADPALRQLVGATSAGQSLLETLASQLLLHGNAWVQIMKDADGRPVELFALRPERVSVIAGGDGWPTAYGYRVGETVLTIPVLDSDASPNIVHIRGFHPADDHYGAGCLCAADRAIAIHNAASEWNHALLDNAARPSGALVCDGGEPARFAGSLRRRIGRRCPTHQPGRRGWLAGGREPARRLGRENRTTGLPAVGSVAVLRSSRRHAGP